MSLRFEMAHFGNSLKKSGQVPVQSQKVKSRKGKGNSASGLSLKYHGPPPHPQLLKGLKWGTWFRYKPLSVGKSFQEDNKRKKHRIV